MSDVGQGFEPQSRSRSYTWHGLPKDDKNLSPDDSKHDDVFVGKHETVENCRESDGNNFAGDVKEVLNMKKPATRRNAWGCMSYADLIARAIESVPERRLTLSQIYEWMIQNVPYFKDKGESNSSAGWKNSIRHNLSLHRRFTRMQNEGTGKSSWWVLNSDALASKTPRRRAVSMDTKTFEKKRSRVRRKVDNSGHHGDVAMVTDATAALRTSSFSECPLDGFASFMPSLEARSGSFSASHLSPLQSGICEVEFDDGGGGCTVPQTLHQPFSWSNCGSGSSGVSSMNSAMFGLAGGDVGFSETLCDGFGTGSYTASVGGGRGASGVGSVYDSSYITGSVGGSTGAGRQLTMLRNLSDNYTESPASQSPSFQSGTTLPPASILLPMPPPYRGVSNHDQQNTKQNMIAATSEQFSPTRMLKTDVQNCVGGFTRYESQRGSGVAATLGNEYGSLADYYGKQSDVGVTYSFHDDGDRHGSGCTEESAGGGEGTSVLRQMLSHGSLYGTPAYTLADESKSSIKCDPDLAVTPTSMISSDAKSACVGGGQKMLNHLNNDDTRHKADPAMDYINVKQDDCKTEAELNSRCAGDEVMERGKDYEILSSYINHEEHLPGDETWEFNLDLMPHMNCENQTS